MTVGSEHGEIVVLKVPNTLAGHCRCRSEAIPNSSVALNYKRVLRFELVDK
ncbi:hypothetical protein SEA_HARLEQUIN_58 [Rhodococcus phage Harlequin]|nr:hypothetical protein SEA_HARLEQUIN_58 [Rhodococcus phage Harlequin]